MSMYAVLQEYLPLGRFNELEAKGFEALKSELRGSIQKGIDFVQKGEDDLLTWSSCSSLKASIHGCGVSSV